MHGETPKSLTGQTRFRRPPQSSCGRYVPGWHSLRTCHPAPLHTRQICMLEFWTAFCNTRFHPLHLLPGAVCTFHVHPAPDKIVRSSMLLH